MKLFATSVLAATVAARSAAPDEPAKPMSCNSAIIKDRKGNGIFDRYRPKGNVNICRFSELMQQLGTVSMERAVYFLDNSKKDLVNDSMQRIIREWRNLAGEGWKDWIVVGTLWRAQQKVSQSDSSEILSDV